MSQIEKEIRIPMSCLAEAITKSGRSLKSLKSLLRPYKFKRQAEGVARTTYYRPAISAVRAYHEAGNDISVFDREIAALRARERAATNRTQRTKFNRNIDAIEAYHKIYGNRRFRVIPSHRLLYKIGSVTITAQPDLWVQEDQEQVLLKIGMAKHGTSYIDMVLSLLRKAAIGSKWRIRAKNFVYLDVRTGKEIICSGGLTRFNRTFRAAAEHIRQVWPDLADMRRADPAS